ncbi:MAG: hypothetical protein BWZ00_00581 [Bacteroidetes bacterium ADurb.BinA174]|nr:MAG: hypothetical protein BWZ00_00581 [Bacteroidetes bacterium ADurb.BinA174]
MSKVTEIHTDKTIDLMKVCEALAEHDAYQIHIKYYDDTTIQYFMCGISTRMNAVSKEDYGYEVRITTIACEKDFELYRDTVKHMLKLTGGKAIYEFENEIENAESFFNDDFIKKSVRDEFNLTMTLVEAKHPIGYFCPMRMFSIGEKMYKKITSFSTNKDEQRNYLYDLIRESQYKYDGENSTIMRILFDPDNEDEEKAERISCYRKNEYRYIQSAQYFGLFDENKDDAIVMKYENLEKIAPATWELYDEDQYIAHDISDEEWETMWNKALEFKV